MLYALELAWQCEYCEGGFHGSQQWKLWFFLLQIRKLVDPMNSSVKTTTVFQITGGVMAKMTAVIIQMKKTAVSNAFLRMLRAGSPFRMPVSKFKLSEGMNMNLSVLQLTFLYIYSHLDKNIQTKLTWISNGRIFEILTVGVIFL